MIAWHSMLHLGNQRASQKPSRPALSAMQIRSMLRPAFAASKIYTKAHFYRSLIESRPLNDYREIVGATMLLSQKLQLPYNPKRRQSGGF